MSISFSLKVILSVNGGRQSPNPIFESQNDRETLLSSVVVAGVKQEQGFWNPLARASEGEEGFT